MSQNSDHYDYLKKKIDLLTQERDCAVEMWNIAEIVADKSKEEVKFLSSTSAVEALKKELEEIQRDYSDAIKLLEHKVKTIENELSHCKESRNEIIEKNKIINTKLLTEIQAKEKLEILLKEANENLTEVGKNLQDQNNKLKQSQEREKQARDKVREALESLQEALEHNDSIEEEKAKLEEKLTEIINGVNEKASKEVEVVKFQLNSKIDSLATQLQSTTLERNKFDLECESLKSETKLQIQQLQMKNKSLIQELTNLRTQQQTETALFHDERNSLRRQLSHLQTELESALLQLRDKQQAPCHECMELQEHVERFALLCKKWEEAATSVTLNFEKYAQETKQFYQLQEKAFHLQNGLEHSL